MNTVTVIDTVNNDRYKSPGKAMLFQLTVSPHALRHDMVGVINIREAISLQSQNSTNNPELWREKESLISGEVSLATGLTCYSR